MSRDAGPFDPTDPRITDTPAGEAQPRSYWLRSSSVPDISPRESAADGASGISRGPGVPTRPDQVSSAPAPLFPDSPPSPVIPPPVFYPEPTTQAKPPTIFHPSERIETKICSRVDLMDIIMNISSNLNKILRYRWLTARRVQRSVKVTKHGIISCHRLRGSAAYRAALL